MDQQSLASMELGILLAHTSAVEGEVIKSGGDTVLGSVTGTLSRDQSEDHTRVQLIQD